METICRFQLKNRYAVFSPLDVHVFILLLHSYDMSFYETNLVNSSSKETKTKKKSIQDKKEEDNRSEREKEMAIQLINHLCNTSTLNLKTTLHPKPHLSSTKRLRTIRVYALSSSTTNARQLIQSGTVRPVRLSEAAAAIDAEGFVLLDIRPVWEREKAHVTGSLHVPLFVEDKDNGPLTLLKKWVHFGYIGLWTGQYFTTLNPDFLEKVEESVPDKSTKLLVACGEGLRYRED